MIGNSSFDLDEIVEFDLLRTLYRWPTERIQSHRHTPPDGVEVTSHAVGFGSRTLFVCPKCKRACRDLFSGHRWLCRLCAGVAYESAAKTGRVRERHVSLTDSKRIRKHYPTAGAERASGQWSSKHQRLSEEFRALEADYVAGFLEREVRWSLARLRSLYRHRRRWLRSTGPELFAELETAYWAILQSSLSAIGSTLPEVAERASAEVLELDHYRRTTERRRMAA